MTTAGDVDPHMFDQLIQLMDQNIHLMQAQQKMMVMRKEGRSMPDGDMKMVSESIAMANKANDSLLHAYQN